jgi:hypothetical protein
MKKLKIINLGNGLIVTSCSNDNGTSQEQEAQNLEKMHAKFCPLQSVNNVRIQLTGPLLIGSKACGGPPDLSPIH